MKLTSENVNSVFMDCLYKEGEDTTEHIKAEGIMITVGFHPERLENHKDDIQAMLYCLPDDFQEDKGSGQSFLNACKDKDSKQWTGLHKRMEELFQLGIAAGLAKWKMPREMWRFFPGGMPYVVILNTKSTIIHYKS